MPVQIKHHVLARRNSQRITADIDSLIRDHSDRGLGAVGGNGRDGFRQRRVLHIADLSHIGDRHQCLYVVLIRFAPAVALRRHNVHGFRLRHDDRVVSSNGQIGDCAVCNVQRGGCRIAGALRVAVDTADRARSVHSHLCAVRVSPVPGVHVDSCHVSL